MWEERRERQGLDTLLDRSLLKIEQLRAGLSTLLMQQLILLGTFFVLPVYLQVVLGLDAFETGKRLFPMSVTMFIAAMAGPRLAAGFAPKRVAQAGLLALVAASVFLLGTIDVELKETEFAVSLAVFGVGAGLLLSQLGNVIMSSVDPAKTNEAGGLQGTAQNLGASLGTALIGAVLIAALTNGFVSRVEDNPAIAAPVREQRDAGRPGGHPHRAGGRRGAGGGRRGGSQRPGEGDRRRLRRSPAPGAEARDRRRRDLRAALALVHAGASGTAYLGPTAGSGSGCSSDLKMAQPTATIGTARNAPTMPSSWLPTITAVSVTIGCRFTVCW